MPNSVKPADAASRPHAAETVIVTQQGAGCIVALQIAQRGDWVYEWLERGEGVGMGIAALHASCELGAATS